MKKCKCGSYAINRHNQTKESDLNSCDVCYWKARFDSSNKDLELAKTLLKNAELVGPDYVNIEHRGEWKKLKHKLLNETTAV